MNSSEYLDYVQENMPKSLGVSKWAVKLFSQTGTDMSFFSEATDEQIKRAIMDTGVSSMNDIMRLITVVKNYMKINGVPEIFSISPSIIFNEIEKCETAILKRKFIDANSFNALLSIVKNKVGGYSPENGTNNALWCVTFLEAIWCGAFSSDFSAFLNMRSSDIQGNYISVNPDNSPSFDCYCDRNILLDMVDTSNLKTWYRNYATVPIVGKYSDSVFKYERRGGNGGNYRFTYNARMKSITKEYLEYPLSPKNLYVSGLVNRIVNRLIESEILGLKEYEECLRYIFNISPNAPRIQKFVLDIISEEFRNSGYNSSFVVLKRYVSGNVSDFIPDQSEKPVWIK